MRNRTLSIAALLLALNIAAFGQVSTSSISTDFGKIVTAAFPVTAATTLYSSEIDVTNFVSPDSTGRIPISWSSNDTVEATISVEGKFSTSHSSAWTALSTIVTKYTTLGTDTLYTKQLISGATAGYNQLALSSKMFNKIRIKVVISTASTNDEGGRLKVWAYLPKFK